MSDPTRRWSPPGTISSAMPLRRHMSMTFSAGTVSSASPCEGQTAPSRGETPCIPGTSWRWAAGYAQHWGAVSCGSLFAFHLRTVQTCTTSIFDAAAAGTFGSKDGQARFQSPFALTAGASSNEGPAQYPASRQRNATALPHEEPTTISGGLRCNSFAISDVHVCSALRIRHWRNGTKLQIATGASVSAAAPCTTRLATRQKVKATAM